MLVCFSSLPAEQQTGHGLADWHGRNQLCFAGGKEKRFAKGKKALCVDDDGAITN